MHVRWILLECTSVRVDLLLYRAPQRFAVVQARVETPGGECAPFPPGITSERVKVHGGSCFRYGAFFRTFSNFRSIADLPVEQLKERASRP